MNLTLWLLFYIGFIKNDVSQLFKECKKEKDEEGRKDGKKEKRDGGKSGGKEVT